MIPDEVVFLEEEFACPLKIRIESARGFTAK
jgi:hypothetical protein